MGESGVGRVDGVGRKDSAHDARGAADQTFGHQRSGWTPAEDSAGNAIDLRGLRSGHASNEEIEHAAEVNLRLVAGLSPAQKPMQGHGIEQCLQRIMRFHHSRAIRCGGSRSLRADRVPDCRQFVFVIHQQVMRTPFASRTRSTASMLPLR